VKLLFEIRPATFWNQAVRGTSDGFFVGPSEHAFRLRVPLADQTLRIDRQEGVEGDIEDQRG